MSTTEQQFQVIADPDTGEILAASEEDRQYLIEEMGRRVIDARVAAAGAVEAARVLNLLMGVGDAWADPDRPGWAITVQPPATPARKVVPHALEEHREALLPLGLAPREETTTSTVYCKVADLTSPAARKALARARLTPEMFLHVPQAGDPQVVVVEPDGGGS